MQCYNKTLKKKQCNFFGKPSVSYELSGHKTKTENWIKLQQKKKHNIPQFEKNSSINKEQDKEDSTKEIETKGKIFF